MTELPETDLERCRRRDPRALEAIWDAYADRVYRLCRGLLGQAADAEDAAQEVLLRIFEKAGSFAGRSRLSTWIYRLTVNHCLNRKRERRRARSSLVRLEDAAEPRCPAPSPLEATSRSEDNEQLDRLLAALPAAQRAVLVLREIEGMSYRDCAEVLAVPIGTVMSRLARARARLAEHLGPGRGRGDGAAEARPAARAEGTR